MQANLGWSTLSTAATENELYVGELTNWRVQKAHAVRFAAVTIASDLASGGRSRKEGSRIFGDFDVS